MRILRAGMPAALVLLSVLSGCPGDDDDTDITKTDPDAGTTGPEKVDSGIPPCPKDTPEFLIGEEDGLSAQGERKLYSARLIAADPKEPPVMLRTDWTVQLTDADGKPADVGIAAACTYMPAHMHGAPPFGGIEKLDEPGQYKLSGLWFMMPGPWEIQLAIEPSTDETAPQSWTNCDAKKRHPGRDFAILRMCIPDK